MYEFLLFNKKNDLLSDLIYRQQIINMEKSKLHMEPFKNPCVVIF